MKVLVFNRGEIAVRACLAAKKLGLRSALFLTPADHEGPAARLADEIHLCPDAEPARSFLSLEELSRAVRETGASHVYPGYGFLSESEELARAVAEAGALLVGPPVEALRVTAHKGRAAELARRCGLATLSVASEPSAADFPVLLKAARGGGGRGNAFVERPEQFADALRQLQHRALSLFRDDAILVERFLTQARHVELQFFGFGGLGVLALGTRDCSLQRNHQKVVEEGPAAPPVAAALQPHVEAICRELGALGYRGAGTVEFLWDVARRQLHFLEINSRIQVEHPVTELLIGEDLVEWQLREALGLGAEALFRREVAPRGHAVEARLYAEDPAQGFVPDTGTVHHLFLPAPPHCRWDLGVAEGSRVTPHYDPLLGKLVAWGNDRAEALGRAALALQAAELHGVRTNLTFLAAIVQHEAVREDRHTTRWIEEAFLREATGAPLPAHVTAELPRHGREEPAASQKSEERWKIAHRR